MSTPSDLSLGGFSPEYVAERVRKKLANSGLPPSFAKLYSQHTRLGSNQLGLQGWRENETWDRLHDAMRLTASGLFEKEADADGWQDSLRRAGELLEWLSHSELNPQSLPLSLIASAVYQLAGYPARATGLLNVSNLNDEHSRILYYFLKGDFQNLFDEISRYWSTRESPAELTELPWGNEEELSVAIHDWITTETVSAMGVLCMYMRWGDSGRVDRAIQKLYAIADLMLHAWDPYSWLLAKLCAEVASIYVDTSMRNNLAELTSASTNVGQQTLEAYLRQGYTLSRSLAWPSQSVGVRQLQKNDSFVMCTPTGSGKTTIAEIAILQSLFAQVNSVNSANFDLAAFDFNELGFDEVEQSQPLALYLVPSRALATEVESKLSKVVERIDNGSISVTGLYGGNDWGPTDAWLTANERTILICTYEKGEALMRFLGPLLLNRVSLIIIDEAHSVLFDGNVDSLVRGENRALRLESLSARLLAYLEDKDSRIIALSAVAAGVESILSNWVSGTNNSVPVSTPYRSTRQLIGCLECSLSGRANIRYDLLDNSDLSFDNDSGDADRPFIPQPFPICQILDKWHKEGAEKRIRPLLFWAAIHLTQSANTQQLRSVLISVSQHIGGYAQDFLDLINKDWKEVSVPSFFRPPTESRKLKLWQQALASSEDYFTVKSREYQLLEKGIVVHHGKMPGLLARLLVQLIDERIIHIVLATSTLSEGVNLPFETVLIPSLQRYDSHTKKQRLIKANEFSNLIGRAGRPGTATEGRSLVVLPNMEVRDQKAYQVREAIQRYDALLQQVKSGAQNAGNLLNANSSPLANLLAQLQTQWQRISKSQSHFEFLSWLEKTSPVDEVSKISAEEESGNAIDSLDVLDSILLSAIVELENISQTDVSLDELEEALQRIWKRSYACYASYQEQTLEELFIHRGLALKQTIYPEQHHRRRLYRTSLPPVDGNRLLTLYDDLVLHLKTGISFADWKSTEQISYIASTIEILSDVKQYHVKNPGGRTKATWHDILHWWVDPIGAKVQPTKTQVSNWHGFISGNFQYRFCWGLGSVISLTMDETFPNQLSTPTLNEWPTTGLPWIVFWMKELMVWGTLDPVVAHLLAHKIEVTRSLAKETSLQYYSIYSQAEPNEIYNASNIRKWAEGLDAENQQSIEEQWHPSVSVSLLRDFQGQKDFWRVIPVVRGSTIYWLDPAGFPMAKSERYSRWDPIHLRRFDFVLDTQQNIVQSSDYL